MLQDEKNEILTTNVWLIQVSWKDLEQVTTKGQVHLSIFCLEYFMKSYIFIINK